MRRRANAHLAVLLAVCTAALAGPALVRAAGSGGAGLGSGGAPTAVTTGGGVQAADATVSATGNGISLSTRESAILRQPQRFTGNAGAAAAGDTIEIERKGRETRWQWTPTAHGIASSNGSFTAVWPTNHIGQFSIRAVIHSRRSSAASASPTVTIVVYRPAIATLYGPGFYGSRTACGTLLRRTTIGVANRTLKCGTRVAVYYRGRMMVVPVIDRGPYANNADWDLTMTTARALGMSSTATIGAVSLTAPR